MDADRFVVISGCSGGGKSTLLIELDRRTPPWPEIYVTDSERRHGLNAGVAEYRRLLDVYPSLSYEVTILPKVSVHERADFVLHILAE
jgi:predicted ATPase